MWHDHRRCRLLLIGFPANAHNVAPRDVPSVLPRARSAPFAVSSAQIQLVQAGVAPKSTDSPSPSFGNSYPRRHERVRGRLCLRRRQCQEVRVVFATPARVPRIPPIGVAIDHRETPSSFTAGTRHLHVRMMCPCRLVEIGVSQADCTRRYRSNNAIGGVDLYGFPQ